MATEIKLPALKENVEVVVQQQDVTKATDSVEADAPLIKLVNQIIADAFKMRASDIHLEPLSKKFRLRYRIDGMMHEMKNPPKRVTKGRAGEQGNSR